MAGLKQTYRLVKSMTKAEKKAFRLYSKMTEGEKDYLQLFDLIDKSDDDSEIKNIFLKKRKGISFAIICDYLYKTIIKVIGEIQQKNTVEDQLLSAYKEALLLFEKGLTNDSLEVIRKNKEVSAIRNKFIFHSLLGQLELDIITSCQFSGLDENQMIGLQSENKRSLYQSLNVMEHASLYQLLYYRFLRTGMVKSEAEKMRLNDLVMSEMMLTENSRYQSLEGDKIHRLFQSIYFLMTSDIKSGLRSFYELNNFFEQHPHLWGDPPYHYIYHLQGIISSLRVAGLYPEMLSFIEKLKQINTRSQAGQIMVLQQVYIFSIQHLVDTQQYHALSKLITEYETCLLQKTIQIPLSGRLSIHYHTALAYYLMDDIKNASRQVKVIYMDKTFSEMMHYRLLRLLNLFILYRKKDFQLLDHEISNYKRIFSEPERIHETERLCFRFFRDFARAATRKKEEEIRILYKNEFLSIQNEALEQNSFFYSDINKLI